MRCFRRPTWLAADDISMERNTCINIDCDDLTARLQDTRLVQHAVFSSIASILTFACFIVIGVAIWR